MKSGILVLFCVGCALPLVGVPMLFVIGGNPWARARPRGLEFKKRR